jgi:hypothetical protein
MAVIEIRTDPSGRTRMLFDLRAVALGDDVARIVSAMTGSYGGASDEAPPRSTPQAASERKISRPVTLPSRRRIRAS